MSEHSEMHHLHVWTLKGLLGLGTGTGRQHKLEELLMYKDHCLFSL